MILGNLTASCKRMKLDHSVCRIQNINSKRIEDLNVRSEITKVLGRDIRANFLGIDLSSDFFGFDNKNKNKQVGPHQTKKLMCSKESH